MNTESCFDVHWDGPWPLGATVPVSAGHVLYQLTGTHCVYGADALLYIGSTGRAGSRLLDHVRGWAYEEADQLTVRLASVGPILDWESWRSTRSAPFAAPCDAAAVRAIEQLLIYVHQPAYNRNEKKESRPLRDSHLRIFNTGVYRSLLPELSTTRWRNAYPTPDEEK